MVVEDNAEAACAALAQEAFAAPAGSSQSGVVLDSGSGALGAVLTLRGGRFTPEYGSKMCTCAPRPLPPPSVLLQAGSLLLVLGEGVECWGLQGARVRCGLPAAREAVSIREAPPLGGPSTA